MRKADELARRERRQKRGGARVAREAALTDSGPGLAQIAGCEPTPAFAALIADELGRLLDGLGDETLRRVAHLRLEGYSNEEVAQRLGCTLRSVERKLERIRKTWEREDRS